MFAFSIVFFQRCSLSEAETGEDRDCDDDGQRLVYTYVGYDERVSVI